MNWIKLISFSLPAILSILNLFSKKIERPRLTTFIVIGIITSALLGGLLEYQDVKERVKLKEKESAAFKKIDELHNIITTKDNVIMTKDEKISTLEEKQKKLEAEMKEIDEKVKLNQIRLFSKKIERIGSGLRATVKFEPVKNEPLGQLIFGASLPIKSTAKILDFWPATEGGAFQTGGDSKKISEDGLAARLIYSLMGPGFPTVELTVSGPTPVTIEGNNGLETFTFQIE